MGVRVLACVLIATSATSAQAAPVDAQACQALAAEWQPLDAHTWWLPAARGEPAADNGGRSVQLLLLRAGNRVWLVGSGPTPAFGALLACAARRVASARVTDVVNTRAAPELAMGNAAFAGARLWALPDVAAAMRQRCGECQQRLRAQLGEVAGASLRPGSIRAPRSIIPTAGRDAGEAGVWGPFDWRALPRNAAGERVLVLRLPAAGVVLAQGLLWAGDVPDLRGTDAARMLAAWDELRRFSQGQRVLGEQGGLTDAAAFDEHIAYVQQLQARLGPALDAGEVWGSRAYESPPHAALPGYARRHPLNVQHLWLEMERALFR